MPKTIWKFGKAGWWAINGKGEKKFFKDKKSASAFRAKFRGSKTKNNSKKKNKTKTKKRRSLNPLKRRKNTPKPKKKGNPSGGGNMTKRKAISVNLAKFGAIIGTVALVSGAAGGLNVSEQLRRGNFSDAMARLWLNIRRNWMSIVGLNLGVALLGRIAGRFAPSAGVKGAFNIKAF